jgi:hypothetical protein
LSFDAKLLWGCSKWCKNVEKDDLDHLILLQSWTRPLFDWLLKVCTKECLSPFVGLLFVILTIGWLNWQCIWVKIGFVHECRSWKLQPQRKGSYETHIWWVNHVDFFPLYLNVMSHFHFPSYAKVCHVC